MFLADDDMEIDELPRNSSCSMERSKSVSKQTSPKIIFEQIQNSNQEEDSNFQHHYGQDALSDDLQENISNSAADQSKEIANKNEEEKSYENRAQDAISSKSNEEEKELNSSEKPFENISQSIGDDSSDLRDQVVNLNGKQLLCYL